MAADLEREVSSVGLVFVGAYCTPVVSHVRRPTEYTVIEWSQSVCIAVRKEKNASIHVVHVEARKGKLNKAWVSGLAQQLKAKKKA